MQTINKWLEAIGMGRYAKNFIEQGFATPRQILLLTIDDLETLGVGIVEHQKKIHRAIINTKAQVEIKYPISELARPLWFPAGIYRRWCKLKFGH